MFAGIVLLTASQGLLSPLVIGDKRIKFSTPVGIRLPAPADRSTVSDPLQVISPDSKELWTRHRHPRCLFDVVPGTEGGESKTILVRWLTGCSIRAQVVIATKVRSYMARPELARSNVNAALENLRISANRDGRFTNSGPHLMGDRPHIWDRLEESVCLTSGSGAPNRLTQSTQETGHGEVLCSLAASRPSIIALQVRNSMPLLRKSGSSAPKELALFWQMQTKDGEIVDVYVYASSLQAFDTVPAGPVGLLKRHRDFLESIASEKFDREGGDKGHPLQISSEDLVQSMAIDITDDLNTADEI